MAKKKREDSQALPSLALVFGYIAIKELQRLEDRVKARLQSDKQLDGVTFGVSADGGVVKLSGVVPDAKARRWAVELAESTTGVEKVVDELAVLE